MNERIKELVEKSYIYDRQNDSSFFNKELFAELIVRECYETIKKDMELAHIQLIPIDFGIYANGRLHRIIRELFGVEL